MGENESIEQAEQKPQEPMSFAFEIYAEQRESNKRLHEQNINLISTLKMLVLSCFVIIAFVVGIFIWYLNQYDFSSTVDQTGVYTYVDTDGNIITSDMTAEEMKSILEVIENGKATDNSQ